MKQFFANYGYVVLSIIGGVIGFKVIQVVILGDGSPMANLIGHIIGGLI